MGVYSLTSQQLPYHYTVQCEIIWLLWIPAYWQKVRTCWKTVLLRFRYNTSRLLGRTLKALSSLPDAVLRSETISHGSSCPFYVDNILPLNVPSLLQIPQQTISSAFACSHTHTPCPLVVPAQFIAKSTQALSGMGNMKRKVDSEDRTYRKEGPSRK